MAVAPVDGTTLFYRELGVGPRCLVMHGGLGIDHHAYSPGLDPLGDVLTLVYYDHRCHGSSGDAPLDTLTVDRFADDADLLRARLGEERIGVLGHSWGGFIAYEHAVRHPERVAFLIIVCSSPTVVHGPEAAERFERLVTPEMREVLALPPPTSSEEWRRRSAALLPLYFKHWDPRFAEVLNDGVRVTSEAAHAAGARIAGWSRWDDLHRITAPTLLVMGKDDFLPHLDAAERALGLLPDATLLIIEDSGHYPWLEQPEPFFRGIRSWLRERGLAGGAVG